MNIKSKNWTAQIDRMPPSPSFRTYGTVTVPHPGITPVLERDLMQDKSFGLRLILSFKTTDTITAQVETDKFVEYKEQGPSNVTGVSIYFEGELVHHINDVLITH